MGSNGAHAGAVRRHRPDGLVVDAIRRPIGFAPLIVNRLDIRLTSDKWRCRPALPVSSRRQGPAFLPLYRVPPTSSWRAVQHRILSLLT